MLRYQVFILLVLLCSGASGQDLLNRRITVNVNRQPLSHVLEIISNRENFYFSYNSHILKKDSLVSHEAMNEPLRQVLDALLGRGFEYLESGNYIIIRRVPIQLKIVTNSMASGDRYYVVSGYVIDETTGERIADASVYEKDRLAVTNTNRDGYFSIKLKTKHRNASLTVSKEYYQDTTVNIRPGYDQRITISLQPLSIGERTVIIGPAGTIAPPSIEVEIPINDEQSWIYRYEKQDSQIVERNAIGKWLISSKQKIQSINLRRFFVARPYQVSVAPGLSTNGPLNSQAINNFSFNVFGGYSGGTNGFELAGLFNIDKKDARYFQLAGIFNLDGGAMSGLQIGGISNTVLDSVNGMQIGGVSNFSQRRVNGFQLAGVSNVGARSVSGLQIAGVANIAAQEMRGLQIGGVVNYAKKLNGVQIGLINISDSSDGYSIGLVNIVFKGYHKLAISANELINLNAAFKTGNRKLYSIFLGGFNAVPDEKVWSFGYGLGTEMVSGKRFVLNLEGSCQHLYLGSWDYYNLLSRAQLQLSYKLNRYLALTAGPAYNVFASNQDISFAGYRSAGAPAGYKVNTLGNTVTGWFGWSAGITLF